MLYAYLYAGFIFVHTLMYTSLDFHAYILL